MNTPAERLWRRVDRSGGPDACWPWLGYRDRHGYGQIGVMPHRLLYTHRLAWEVSKGPVPVGHYVCHACDNPPCCNPTHLFTGTQKDNMADAARKGRAKSGVTKLTADQVQSIRALFGHIPQKEIAERFGTSEMNVSWIVRGITWKNL
jgi:hypothetical protein